MVDLYLLNFFSRVRRDATRNSDLSILGSSKVGPLVVCSFPCWGVTVFPRILGFKDSPCHSLDLPTCQGNSHDECPETEVENSWLYDCVSVADCCCWSNGTIKMLHPCPSGTPFDLAMNEPGYKDTDRIQKFKVNHDVPKLQKFDAT